MFAICGKEMCMANTILVTGATGTIGRDVRAEELAREALRSGQVCAIQTKQKKCLVPILP